MTDILLERLNIGGIEEREAAARIAELEAQLREAEQFARDMAHKLDIPYEPPIVKGECAYLVALESLKERAVTAEADAGRLRTALENVEWFRVLQVRLCPWCNGLESDGHRPGCGLQDAIRFTTADYNKGE